MTDFQIMYTYLKKMGITTLNDKDVNLALSLGGLDEWPLPLAPSCGSPLAEPDTREARGLEMY